MFRVPKFLDKLFDGNQRDVDHIIKTVVQPVNALEEQTRKIDDLAGAFMQLRKRVQDGPETLDDVMVEGFAIIREASRRSIGKFHYEVQIIGATALHFGRIAEMRTGEGKTLTAALALSLNALDGKGAHLVTVNDYLAKVGMEEMSLLYRTLGLTVGLVTRDMSPPQRQQAYLSDITYITNSELGFDYLRDNMAQDKGSLVLRADHPLHFAIVDEVDSILIDEARTPLIISGQAEQAPSSQYHTVNALARRLKRGEPAEPGVREAPTGDFVAEEKSKQVHLTEEGIERIEKMLGLDGLYTPDNMSLAHMIQQAIRAQHLYHREKEYIVNEKREVIIVDESTGRAMEGRRFGEGLHQAIEAKEGVKIENENQTLATITYQNFFRLYDKFAGMTGTAKTEEKEFLDIYGSDVLVVPTNRGVQRIDSNDLVYRSRNGKYDAVVREVKEVHATGRPVLIGTASIVTSEEMSAKLQAAGIEHAVLNAKFEAQEASIISQAGRSGTVTIATNMAGRGTDIMLGGNDEFMIGEALEHNFGINRYAPEAEDFIKAVSRGDARAQELGRALPGVTDDFIQKAIALHNDTLADRQRVKDLGGLHIIGTERHESRRIDNQLRGRAGRQGDPGSSRFYISFDDDLMRLFASDRVLSMMENAGFDDTQPIEAPMVTGAMERAQARVEDRNFGTRKQLLEFDNVMSSQRETIYGQRREVLLGEDDEVMLSLEGMVGDHIEMLVDIYIDPELPSEEWDIDGLRTAVASSVPQLEGFDFESLRDKDVDGVEEALISATADALEERVDELGAGMSNALARMVLLQVVDQNWKEHLYNMDMLRQGIHLRSYAQRDPFTEYKFEATHMFNEMIETVKGSVTQQFFGMQFSPQFS